MSTMTDQTDRDKMQAHLRRLMERATTTDPEEALTFESPASMTVSGKFVHVELSGGGPSTEMLAEYYDEDEASAWYESEPRGAWFTYKDWGTREDVYIGAADAGRIMQAITRDPAELWGDE